MQLHWHFLAEITAKTKLKNYAITDTNRNLARTINFKTFYT